MAVTRTRGRFAIASSVNVAEKLRGITGFVPAQASPDNRKTQSLCEKVSLGSDEDEVFVREGGNLGQACIGAPVAML